MSTTTKTRSFGTYYARTPDTVVPGGGVTMGVENTFGLPQTTISQGNPWFRSQSRDRGFRGRDIGGAFSTRRYVWEPQFADRKFTLQAYYGNGTYFRGGTIHSMQPDFNTLSVNLPQVSDITLDSWGTSAIKSVIPTKSKIDVVVSTVELAREGLPSLIGQGLLKSKLKDFRKVGDEVLNYEFGIKPLISDIQGLAQSIVSAEERIKQLERDSGRLVRRRFRFPDREETFVTNHKGASALPYGWHNTYLWDGFSRCERQTITTYKTERWFSGAFTYHLNIGERQRSQMTEAADNARLLLGIKLDAETLWNLTPWTWLADWFGNAGDIMTNVSHFSRDGLVMPYGYMMAQQTATVSSSSKLYWRDPAGPQAVHDVHGFVRKQRRPATPFGFGLSDLVLDSRQTSILAALGITKVPRR